MELNDAPVRQPELEAIVRRRIEAARGIPFAEFMALSLYHPEFGYYMASRKRIGREGDFFTSSSVHALFGRLVCRQLRQMWDLLGRGTFTVAEQGAGAGAPGTRCSECRRGRCRILCSAALSPCGGQPRRTPEAAALTRPAPVSGRLVRAGRVDRNGGVLSVQRTGGCVPGACHREAARTNPGSLRDQPGGRVSPKNCALPKIRRSPHTCAAWPLI